MAKESPIVEQEADITSRRDIIPFLKDLRKQTITDESNRAEWDAKNEEWYARRYAEVDKDLAYPWPGASNIWIPMSDMLIDKVKPSLLNLYTQPNPIVHFRPRQPISFDRARKLELFYDWGWRTSMRGAVDEFSYAMDSMLETGWGALMTTYAYQTEATTLVIHKKFLPPPLNRFQVVKSDLAANTIRQISGGQINPITKDQFDQNIALIEDTVRRLYGLQEDDPMDRKALSKIVRFLRNNEKEVRVDLRSEIENSPQIVSINTEDLILPEWTQDIQKLDRATIKMRMTPQAMMRRIDDEDWDKDAVERAINNKRARTDKSFGPFNPRSQLQAEREGITSQESEDTVEVWVSWCYYDYDRDSRNRLSVAMYQPSTMDVFKFIQNPFKHGQIPITIFPYELNKRRLYDSRGIPEKIRDMEEEVAWQHRMKLNNGTIKTNPSLGIVQRNNLEPIHLKFLPGEMIPMKQQGDIQPINFGADTSLFQEREELLLRNFMEAYVGSPDLALTSLQGQQSQSKTATEIATIQELSQVSLSYHATIVQQRMQRVHGQVWDLWNQFGPDEFFFRLTGENPVRLTKYEMQGNFDIIPRGSVGTTNPILEEQRALNRLTVAAQIVKPVIDNDPEARFQIDMVELARDWFQKSDLLLSEKVLRRIPEEERREILARRNQSQQERRALESGQPISLERAAQLADKVSKEAPKGGDQLVTL